MLNPELESGMSGLGCLEARRKIGTSDDVETLAWIEVALDVMHDGQHMTAASPSQALSGLVPCSVC
jgi:hypothetical protein